MARKKKIIVVGAGKFGARLVEKLVELDAEVVAIDSNPARLAVVQGRATLAVSLDVSDPAALRELDLPMDQIDAAVVTVADNIEGSILATLVLKELGVKQVISRATSVAHRLALQKVGADRVVFPEHDMAERLGQALLATHLEDFIGISERMGIATLRAGEELVGKSLREIEFRKRYGGYVLALKRGPVAPDEQAGLEEGAAEEEGFREVLDLPGADERIQPGDALVVLAPRDKLAVLPGATQTG